MSFSPFFVSQMSWVSLGWDSDFGSPKYVGYCQLRQSPIDKATQSEIYFQAIEFLRT